MESLFGTIDLIEHIYIPDGVKMDNEAYEILRYSICLKSISITKEQYNKNLIGRYDVEIRDANEQKVVVK